MAERSVSNKSLRTVTAYHIIKGGNGFFVQISNNKRSRSWLSYRNSREIPERETP